MTLESTIINGQLVLDTPQMLPEGAKVRIEIRQPVASLQERLRHLRHAASDCGVSLSNEAVSSDAIYD